MRLIRHMLVAALVALPLVPVQAQDARLRMATTTSTDNSGLLAVLHPPFEDQCDCKVDVIAVGTGKALRLGENGDVDIVFVHAPPAEKRFVEAGHGVDRTAVMHNDFVILGPAGDLAGVADTGSVAQALQAIAAAAATFVSRGDDSGTHKKEKSLWETAGIDPSGSWYQAAGQGMGAVLQISEEKQAYTLADRGTYLAYRDKITLKVVSEGDEVLFNPYHVMAVNPEKHPHVNDDLAKTYIDFVVSREGQKIIAGYQVAGEQLFHPDAIPDP